MESSITSTESISQIILNTINSLFSQLFSSVDQSSFSALDKLAFIEPDILSDSFLIRIFGSNPTNGILLIVNSLLFGFSIYYCFRLLYSNFTASPIEHPYQFIFKLLIFGIVIHFSYFICENFISLNSLISSSIREIGESIFHQDISFSSLVQNLNFTLLSDGTNFNLFSFDGLMKCFISFCLFSLLFSYALRFIMVKIFILLAPFAFLSLINQSTSWFFKTWIRTLFSLLVIQSFISLILLIIFSLDFHSTDIFSKLLCIGSVYALSYMNSYVRQIFGGISTDISANINLMRSMIKTS